MRTSAVVLPAVVLGTIWGTVEAVMVVDIPYVGRRAVLNLRGGSLSLERGEKADAPILPKDSTEEANDQNTTTLSSSPPSPPSYDFSLLQPGEEMEDSVHFQRYLRMQKGHIEKAKKAFNETLHWRQEHNVDTILTRPHPDYDICKRIQVHHFPGKDPADHIIFIQRPGGLDFELGYFNNVTKEDLLNHYVWVLEYCWNILEPEPNQIMTNVLDLKGLQFSRVQQYLGFIRNFLSVMSHHYPQRSYKTLIINSPSWTSMAYKLVAPFLRESTRKKISIFSRGSRQDKMLLEVLGPEACPTDLLSTGAKRDSSAPHLMEGVYDNELESTMREFCVARLEEAGMDMKKIRELS